MSMYWLMWILFSFGTMSLSVALTEYLLPEHSIRDIWGRLIVGAVLCIAGILILVTR